MTPATSRRPAERSGTGALGRVADLVSGGVAPTVGSRRQDAQAAVVEGFAAVVWCGWAQVSVVPWLSTVLTVAGIAGFGVAVAGFVTAARAAQLEGPPVRRDAGDRRPRYPLVLGAEVAALVIGTLVLAVTGLLGWTPVWVCLLMGLHAVPLGRWLGTGLLVGVGAALVLVAVLALLLALLGPVATTTVTGIGAGLVLLAAGALSLAGRAEVPALLV